VSTFVWLTVMTALRVLQRNRLRAGLTMLGIIIGVGAVIAMVSIGEGAKLAVHRQIASMGANSILIWPNYSMVSGVRGGQGAVITLTVADAIDLKKKIPLLVEVGWSRSGSMQVMSGGRNWSTNVIGASPSVLTVRDWAYSSGGPFTQTDMDTAARVALVGQTVVDNLFDPGEEPVGSVIRLKNVPIRVIGVLSPKGQSPSGSDQDDVVIIPFTTAERKVLGTSFLGSVNGVHVSTDRTEDVFDAVEHIREVLRSRHRLQGDRPDDFIIRTQIDVAKVQEGTSETLTGMLRPSRSLSAASAL
jgi:putative ABC transport system permease protein